MTQIPLKDNMIWYPVAMEKLAKNNDPLCFRRAVLRLWQVYHEEPNTYSIRGDTDYWPTIVREDAGFNEYIWYGLETEFLDWMEATNVQYRIRVLDGKLVSLGHLYLEFPSVEECLLFLTAWAGQL
jgi:hypothetical protein